MAESVGTPRYTRVVTRRKCTNGSPHDRNSTANATGRRARRAFRTLICPATQRHQTTISREKPAQTSVSTRYPSELVALDVTNPEVMPNIDSGQRYVTA